jgi:GT2 family glycosyltransferase
MRYAIADIEVTEPLPELRLEPDETGVGLLVRRRGRPVHFSLEELGPGATLAPDAVGRLVAGAAAEALVVEAIRAEFAPAVEPGPISLTVAVCTRARTEELEGCLQSVLALRSSERSFEVLVVDNAPPDEKTHEVVGGLADVRYALEPVAGLDVARNRALREAGGDWVAFLDDDVVVDRGWLAGLEEAVGENPDAAAVTGLVLPWELASEAQIVFERRGGFRRGFDKLRYEGPRRLYNPLYPCGAGMFGAGCNMVLRRDVALALGGFDEALDTGPPLPGGGDLDVFYRLVRAGHPLVYEPRLLVFHKHRRGREALRRQYRTWGEGLMAFVTKTYAADPPQRSKLRRLVRWWFAEELRELRRSLRGASPLDPDLVLAETIGGAAGLMGAYRRSVRRMRRRREAR